MLVRHDQSRQLYVFLSLITIENVPDLYSFNWYLLFVYWVLGKSLDEMNITLLFLFVSYFFSLGIICIVLIGCVIFCEMAKAKEKWFTNFFEQSTVCVKQPWAQSLSWCNRKAMAGFLICSTETHFQWLWNCCIFLLILHHIGIALCQFLVNWYI